MGDIFGYEKDSQGQIEEYRESWKDHFDAKDGRCKAACIPVKCGCGDWMHERVETVMEDGVPGRKDYVSLCLNCGSFYTKTVRKRIWTLKDGERKSHISHLMQLNYEG